MRVLLDVRGGLACVEAVSRGRPGRLGRVVFSHPVLRASNDKATLRTSLSRARVCRPRPVLDMRVTQVQKPDIRLRHWCAMKCEPPRFSDEENGSRVSDCIASLAEATSRLVWRVSSPATWRPRLMAGPSLFLFSWRAAAGATIDSGLSYTRCRRSRAHCSKLRRREHKTVAKLRKVTRRSGLAHTACRWSRFARMTAIKFDFPRGEMQNDP